VVQVNKDGLPTNPASLSAFLNADPRWKITATPGGIEKQEADGQKDFVNSEELPTRSPWNQLKALGVVLLDDLEAAKHAHRLFCRVQLPKDWKKASTDHPMWSDLLDEKGRKRASIFYKAAFYDQDAFLTLECRYCSGIFPEDMYKSEIPYEERERAPWYGIVKDWDSTILFKTKPYVGPKSTTTARAKAKYAKKAELETEAKAWLMEKFPKFDSVLEYWD
jgi:hypothetical protein